MQEKIAGDLEVGQLMVGDIKDRGQTEIICRYFGKPEIIDICKNKEYVIVQK